MLDESDAHFGMYLPWSFGSHPIHFTFSMSTSFAGSLIVNKTLESSDTDFFTRIESIFRVFSRKIGLKRNSLFLIWKQRESLPKIPTINVSTWAKTIGAANHHTQRLDMGQKNKNRSHLSWHRPNFPFSSIHQFCPTIWNDWMNCQMHFVRRWKIFGLHSAMQSRIWLMNLFVPQRKCL